MSTVGNDGGLLVPSGATVSSAVVLVVFWGGSVTAGPAAAGPSNSIVPFATPAADPSPPTIFPITISGTVLPTPDGRSIVAAPRAARLSVGATVASQELGFDPAFCDI